MKNIKNMLFAGVVALLIFCSNGYSQNWGFSLPYGGGGFAINKKNWVAGLNGISAGGGRSGWGFQLPDGAGFYNGNPYGGGCGQGWNGGVVVAPVPQVVVRPGWRNGYGWNYGQNFPRQIPGSTPVQVYGAWQNGAAVYRSANGQMWVQQPF